MSKVEVVARSLCAAWTILLVVLMSLGTLSSARIGSMTWGPQHDIWSAAIAISQIKFGLSGKLAYPEVEQAIADEVTSTKSAWNVMDDTTRALLQDPAAVTRGFQKAAALTKDQIAVPPTKDGYVSDWCEDLGYADFYNLAFRLFGFNAFSTHVLYMGILLLSVLVFQAVYFGDRIAMTTLLLSVTALFLLSSATFFNESVPSFAANRFLSTLGLVPLVFLLFTVSRRTSLGRLEIGATALQTLILASAIAFRGSATWVLFAFGSLFIGLTIPRILRSDNALHSLRSLRGSRNWMAIRVVGRQLTGGSLGRVSITGLVVFAVVICASLIKTAQIDGRYFRDSNLPHHLVWHSAYLGLTLHPKWPIYKPYPDIPDSRTDGVGFRLFEHRMKESGEPAVSQSNEIYHAYYYRARPYEKLIRYEYLSFIMAHPRYALQLFFYYKPMRLKEVLLDLFRSIPLSAAVLAAVSVLLGCLLIALSRRTAVSSSAQLASIVGLIWLCSLLPSFWAYPELYVVSDIAWATLLVLLVSPCLIAAFAASAVVRIGHVRRQIGPPSPVESAAP